MKITYDKQADAIYISFESGNSKVEKTFGDWPYHVDLNEDGSVAGIEIMDASTMFDAAYLKKLAEQKNN